MTLANRLLQDKGFFIHLLVYGLVNLLLAVINIATNPNHLWFYWPLIGWGIGIIGHGILVHLATRTKTTPSPG